MQDDKFEHASMRYLKFEISCFNRPINHHFVNKSNRIIHVKISCFYDTLSIQIIHCLKSLVQLYYD